MELNFYHLEIFITFAPSNRNDKTYYLRRRFAYLANENLRNFQRVQEITERFPRITWAAVSHLAHRFSQDLHLEIIQGSPRLLF